MASFYTSYMEYEEIPDEYGVKRLKKEHKFEVDVHIDDAMSSWESYANTQTHENFDPECLKIFLLTYSGGKVYIKVEYDLLQHGVYVIRRGR